MCLAVLWVWVSSGPAPACRKAAVVARRVTSVASWLLVGGSRFLRVTSLPFNRVVLCAQPHVSSREQSNGVGERVAHVGLTGLQSASHRRCSHVSCGSRIHMRTSCLTHLSRCLLCLHTGMLVLRPTGVHAGALRWAWGGAGAGCSSSSLCAAEAQLLQVPCRGGR